MVRLVPTALHWHVNNWNDDLTPKCMSLLLSGRARNVYGGLTEEERSSSAVNLRAVTLTLDPCESENWNQASFSSRRRLPTENLVMPLAYPSVKGATQDLLAREHFVAHVEVGELQIRRAKQTLEAAINC